MGLKYRFRATDFTATSFDTAEDKARFAKQFGAFVESDFAKGKFPKAFYRRLTNCFGHIAHFNHDGFYAHFFTTTEGKLDFLRQCAQWPCHGEASHTYSDVERKLIAWIKTEGLVQTYEERFAGEVEERERSALRRLAKKYPDELRSEKAS